MSMPTPSGRRALVDQLEGMLRDAEAGRPQVYCLWGAVGAGKGAIANDLAQLAADRGHGVARGRAVREVPGGALLEALGFARPCPGAPIDMLGVGVVRSEQVSEGGHRDREKGSGALKRSNLRLPTGRRVPRAHRHLVDALFAMAGDGPLLVILDGLHDVDATSLRALALLVARLAEAKAEARPLSISVLMTCKDTAPERVRKRLSEWSERGLCQPVRVPPLTTDDALYALRTAGCPQPTAGLAAALLRWAGGNGRYLSALVGELARQGAWDTPSEWSPRGKSGPALDRFVLPKSLAEAIEREVARLPPFTRHRLAQAACLGDGCAIDALAAASGLPVPRVLGQLAEAPHVASVRDQRLWFESGLYRHALCEELDLSERQELHLAVGEWWLAGTRTGRDGASAWGVCETGRDVPGRDVSGREASAGAAPPRAGAPAVTAPPPGARQAVGDAPPFGLRGCDAWQITQQLLAAGHLAERPVLAQTALAAATWLFAIEAFDDASRAYEAAALSASDRATQALMHYRAGIAHQMDREPARARMQFQLSLSAYQELQDDQGLGMVLAAAPIGWGGRWSTPGAADHSRLSTLDRSPASNPEHTDSEWLASHRHVDRNAMG